MSSVNLPIIASFRSFALLQTNDEYCRLSTRLGGSPVLKAAITEFLIASYTLPIFCYFFNTHNANRR